MPMSAQYASRFLVHLDGYTSSTQLQLLLLSNSGVQQDSYFYSTGTLPYSHTFMSPRRLHCGRSLDSAISAADRRADAWRPSGSERAGSSILSKRARRLYWLTLLLLSRGG